MNLLEGLIGKDFGFGKLDMEDAKFHSRWKPSSGHKGGWRVTRGVAPLQELEGKNGKLILFKSMASAQRCADKLNTDNILNDG